MPELEKYILHIVLLINEQVRKGYESYDLKLGDIKNVKD